MSLTYGDVVTNMVLGPKQFVRANASASGFEVCTIPDAGLNYSQTALSRTLNSNFQPSTTNNALVSYSVDISCTMSLTSGQSGTVFLEISADGSTGWSTLNQGTNSNSGTLTIGLALTQIGTACVSGTVPANYYARLRTANNTGSPTFTYKSGQETLI